MLEDVTREVELSFRRFDGTLMIDGDFLSSRDRFVVIISLINSSSSFWFLISCPVWPQQPALGLKVASELRLGCCQATVLFDFSSEFANHFEYWDHRWQCRRLTESLSCPKMDDRINRLARKEISKESVPRGIAVRAVKVFRGANCFPLPGVGESAIRD